MADEVVRSRTSSDDAARKRRNARPDNPIYRSASTTADAGSISSERHEYVNRSTSSRGFPRRGISPNRQAYDSEEFRSVPYFNRRYAGDYNDRQSARMPHVQTQYTEHSSMRAEGGRRFAGYRMRSDSVDSAQIEGLPRLSDRLPVDATSAARRVGGDERSPASLSYIQLCQSFEALGPLDRSEEEETEYNAKHSGQAEQKPPERFASKKCERDSSREEVLQDESNSNSFTRGILRIPPGLIYGRERILSDSDRSSIRSSTAEEEWNSSESSSEECTLTEKGGDDKLSNNRGSAKMNAVSASGEVRGSNSTSASSLQPPKMTDFPVYHEIANNEGPRMQKINDSISSLLCRVRKRDLNAAGYVIELSSELCEIYCTLLLRDISFTYTMNIEQYLWRQAFYTPIDVLRTVVKSPGDSSRMFRDVLLKLLNNGITFYTRLLHLYEKELQMDLEKVIVCPLGQSDGFWNVYSAPNTESSRCQIAARSYSRHLISLGDLIRYKTFAEGSEDYSKARTMYLRSAQLWPASGHCYNQLAVVANYSAHALDEIFYCVRALSAEYPFKVARERLCVRLAAIKRKVDKYEPELDLECGEVKEDDELAASADRPYELWLDIEDIESNVGDAYIFQTFLNREPLQLYRRAICYMINTVGILVTKIGMESFPSAAERSIAQLVALVEQESSPVSAEQLIQIAALLIYAVHCNAVVGEEDVCTMQQQLAVQALVSVFGALLRPITSRLKQICTWIRNPAEVPRVVRRVLPAVCVICEWLSCTMASEIYHAMPSVEPLSVSIVEVDTWQLLAEIANELFLWQGCGLLVKIRNSTDTNCSCILPELAYLSSFSTVFPSYPRVLRYTCPSMESTEDVNPLQIRLAKLLFTANYLDGSELPCFFICKTSGLFIRKKHIVGRDWEQSKLPSVDQNEFSFCTQKPRDGSLPLSREELLERELRKYQQLLVVKPYYVVLDTNAFIDHLFAIQKILQCERFRVMIPTTVVHELIELQRGDQGNYRAEAVTEAARQANEWIREQARRMHSRLFTLTMQGLCVPITIVREYGAKDGDMVNDDRILRSCMNYTQVEPAPESMFSNVKVPQGIPIIYRNIVLITDDRVLNMKAMSEHIPCRTMVQFKKWAKII